jgi:hypothetical protein
MRFSVVYNIFILVTFKDVYYRNVTVSKILTVALAHFILKTLKISKNTVNILLTVTLR